MVDIKKLAQIIATSLIELSKEELNELLVELKETYNLEPSVPEIIEVTTPEVQKEKESFKITLNSIGNATKGSVVRLIKEHLGLSLKEAMDLVKESEIQPVVIKENVIQKESDELQEKFSAIGAILEIS